jgi:hypothetical protein
MWDSSDQLRVSNATLSLLARLGYRAIQIAEKWIDVRTGQLHLVVDVAHTCSDSMSFAESTLAQYAPSNHRDRNDIPPDESHVSSPALPGRDADCKGH